MANNLSPEVVTVNQGEAGVEPWLVNIQGGTVSVSNDVLTDKFSSEFARLLEKRFLDTEEVRYDIPPDVALANNSIYTGAAPDGALTSEPVWTVIRAYFNNAKLPERQRIRFNVAWDDRALGW